MPLDSREGLAELMGLAGRRPPVLDAEALTEASAEYRLKLEENPQDTAARLGLATMAYAAGDTAKAMAILRDRSTDRSSPAVAALLALLYEETGDRESAATLFERAWRVGRGGDYETLSLLAVLALRLDKTEQARALADSALTLRPGSVPALRLMAAVESRAGNIRRALVLWESVRRQNPEDTGVLEELVSLNMTLPDTEAARETAHALLGLDPENFIANFALATLADAAGQLLRAESHLRSCIQDVLHPAYPKALNNLAYCLVRQGRAEEALEYARQAVALEPNDHQLRHTLAHALLGARRYEEAEEQILQARQLAPDDPKHLLLHGEIYTATGRPTIGAECARRALPLLEGTWRSRAQRLLDSAP